MPQNAAGTLRGRCGGAIRCAVGRSCVVCIPWPRAGGESAAGGAGMLPSCGFREALCATFCSTHPSTGWADTHLRTVLHNSGDRVQRSLLLFRSSAAVSLLGRGTAPLHHQRQHCSHIRPKAESERLGARCYCLHARLCSLAGLRGLHALHELLHELLCLAVIKMH